MTTLTRDDVLRPGLFGDNCAADSRRMEFDYGNEALRLAGVRPDAVFIGDSITHLWELQAYFGGTGKVLINRGIGGDISTHVRRRFAADVLQLQPGLVVVKIGTNDLAWEPQLLDEAKTALVSENIAAMTADALAAGLRMAVCSLLPIWGPSWLEDAEFAVRKNAQIVRINDRLRALAAATGAIYVDYHAEMLDDAGALRRELADDGVHPHALGYAIMADVLRRTLAARNVTI